jgi:coproporphyrinogen III oxidase-like Fe-S oxidoreductase
MFDLQILADQPLIKFNRQLPMFNWHYPFDREEDRLVDALAPFTNPGRIATRRRAVYVHIPFCDTICNFCLFQKGKYRSSAEIQDYLEALVAEFELKSRLLESNGVDAIFIGGGTPSVLDPEQIRVLGEAIARSFDLQDLKEFTCEIEVKSITREKLEAMRSIGVNRISFGAQTFSPKYRKLFSLDATLEQIQEAAKQANSLFAYTNVDILYGMAGQSEDELCRDAEAAMRLQTTTIDFYPINNLTAPRAMHRAAGKSGLDYLTAATRVQYRIKLDNLLRLHGYTPINGYGYSRVNKTHAAGVVQQSPKFLYHEIVYGYEDDEIVGYGASAISQLPGFNLHNAPDRRKYADLVLKDRKLPHAAFGLNLSPERGIVSFPFRGVLEKSRIRWERIPLETWIAFQDAIQAGLVVEHHDRYELSPAGWLFYVNLMYYLMPQPGKKWISRTIERQYGDGRRCGDTDLSQWAAGQHLS